MKFKQSLATLILGNLRSCARLSVSANASNISGSAIPSNSTAEAPRKTPPSNLATATAELNYPLLATLASTLSFSAPTGGGIHSKRFGTVIFGVVVSFGFFMWSSSAINPSMKLWVLRATWVFLLPLRVPVLSRPSSPVGDSCYYFLQKETWTLSEINFG